MMQTIELKSAPELKRLVLAAFPDYRKKSVFLSVFGERGVNVNSYWDGGSRAVYALVEMATMRRKALPTGSHPYFDISSRGLAGQETPDVAVDHVGNVTLKRLPEGIALIEGGTFCGKPATAHIRVNAANMAKYLTAAA